MRKQLRVLFVAMANSVHTARCLEQLSRCGWDLQLFPVEDSGLHSELRNVTFHEMWWRRRPRTGRGVTVRGSWPVPWGGGVARRLAARFFPSWLDRAWALASTISRVRPDIVHSLEIQHAGYLTLAARELLPDAFPTWIVTNWGSDIYLFGRLAEHKERIRAVMGSCDYYGCECQRDVVLGRTFGFCGALLPVLPNTGGFDLKRAWELREPGPSSARRLILLKGYQGWAGRALFGLRAIRLCAHALRGYRVAVYLAGEDVRIAAELVRLSTGVPIDIVPACSHEDMLRLHGMARASIGLSISDAASTSFLEALGMGSFPIQSCTSCADEWIEGGVTGLIVDPEDPEMIAQAIRRAVTDDELVDRAAELNWQTAVDRLDYGKIQQQVIEMYERVAREGRSRRGGNAA